jgi:hypothetical protein
MNDRQNVNLVSLDVADDSVRPYEDLPDLFMFEFAHRSP